jgi:membrane protease YdiL (CAAX protease family)
VEPAAPLTEASPTRILPIERAAAALEVLLCSGFPTQLVIITVLATFGMRPRALDGTFSAPFVFTLTLLDTALLVSLVCFFLRAHRESVRDALFGSRRIGRELLLGLALVQLVAPWLRNVAHNPLADLAKTRGQAVLFAFVVMVAGGVREEIQRGFVLRRFEQFLGGGAAGLVVFSAIFGLGHIEQGYDVVLATATLGVFWGAITLRRRSVAAPLAAHAGFNLLQVVRFLVWGA